MFKLSIIKDNIVTNTCVRNTEAELSLWLDEQKQNNSFGKNERWVTAEQEDVINALQSRLVEATALKPAHYEYLLPAEYEVAIENLSAQAVKENVENAVGNAMGFGAKMLREFAAENILLGITQDGKTKSVRRAMSEVISALSTGSLYDAIDELRSIPEESKDLKYITNARLLDAVNKIEAYLGLDESETL